MKSAFLRGRLPTLLAGVLLGVTITTSTGWLGSSGESAEAKELKELKAKHELSKALTGVMAMSLFKLKTDAWFLSNSIARFRDGSDWRQVVPEVEKNMRQLHVDFVGVQGIQADYGKLCEHLGVSQMRDLQTSELAIGAAVP